MGEEVGCSTLLHYQVNILNFESKKLFLSLFNFVKSLGSHTVSWKVQDKAQEDLCAAPGMQL